jgi:hypothetical protein
MTNHEKIARDIETLRESLQLNQLDLVRLHLTPEERGGIVENSRLLQMDLKVLIDRLWEGDIEE